MGDESPSSARINSFVGRRRELNELASGLSQAAFGRARLFLVSGEPGIGKTRLADELAAYANADGFLVLWGRCWESDGAPAYWPWIQILRSCDAGFRQARMTSSSARVKLDFEAQRLLAQLSSPMTGERREPPGDREEAQFQLFDSVASILKSIARAQPLLLILDDLHDSDPASLRMLTFIVNQLDRTCILGTYRDFELKKSTTHSHLIGKLARAAYHIPLGSLDRHETQALAHAVAGSHVSEQVVALVFQATGGNPFFIEGCVRLLRAEGADLETRDPQAIQLKLPHGVRESIRRRCAKLSARANYLIRIAAVIGNEIDYEIVNANLELPMEQLLDLVDECCAAGLLTAIDDRRCRFSHALIRSSIYEELPNGERLKLHLQIGEALEQKSAANPGSHLAELAHHFRQAADNPKIAERAIIYSVRAGEAGAGVFAYEETRSHWEGALKLMERFGAGLEKRAELLERFGSDQVVSSSSDMVRFLEEALALYRQCGRRDRAASIQGWLGYSLAVLPGPQMDVRRGLALLRRAEDEVRSGPDSYDKAIIYISLAGAAHQAIESHEGLAAAERAAQIASMINNPTLWAAAVAAVGIHSLRLGHVADAYAFLGQARMNVEPSIRAATSAIAAWGGLFCITLWDPAEAESWCAAELTRPRTIQMANWRSLLLHQRIEADIIRGELAEARRMLDELGHGGRLSALIALYDGDWDRALAVGVKQLQDSRRIGSRFTELLCHFALARIHAARGEEREAEASLRHALTIARAGPHKPAEVEARAGLALVYAHTEKPGDAAEQLSRCSELIKTGEEWRGLAGTVARAQAAVAAAAGKFDTAFLEFDCATSIFERYSLAWEEAETFQEWGLALMANSDHRLASKKFLAAAKLYKRCGAGGVWVDRAQSTIGSFGSPKSDRSGSPKEDTAADNKRSDDLQGVFRREGEYWTVGFSDHTLRLKDSKGLSYLANLLARPGTEISAQDLAASGGTATKTIQYETRIWDGAADVAVGLGDAGAMLDRRAVAQYKRRLAELDEQIAEAERNHDTGWYDTVQRERECLVHELSAALGLGGKERRVASHSERARWLVTKGIKSAIRKIAQANPDLGHHLRLSVRTGRLCVYLPAQPVSWHF